ncbi:non-ribosomal peptide synthetase, partial [Pseudoalteromonas luteoviolacea]
MKMNRLLSELQSNGVKVSNVNGKLNLKVPKDLDPKLKSKLVEHKNEFKLFLESIYVKDSIKPFARVGNSFDASFSQQRLWFVDQLQGGSPEYNMPTVFKVEGHLDLTLLNDVFAHIIERHEVLRTVYEDVKGEPKQRILPMSEVAFKIHEKNLTDLTCETKSEAVNTFVETDLLEPFNLAQDVMLRVSYIHTETDAGVLIFNMHHIASDGWSMEVLTKEFFALYEAFSSGQPSPLPELEIQYVDYAHWQRNHITGEVLDTQLDYWAMQLDELPPVHSLPLVSSRPEVKKHVGAGVHGSLPAAVGQKLQALAKQHQLTPFMLLHGALSLLLSRHSNSSDVVIGTPVANRLQDELSPLIGFFVNTLVLRADTEHETLSEYFSHIKDVHLGAQANQNVPFEQLVERLNVPRSTAYTPLFQILLSTSTDYGVTNDPAPVAMSDVTLLPYESDKIQAKFDLDINMSISDEGVGVFWKYDVSLFDEAYVQCLNVHLCQLLTELSEVTHSDIPPHSLGMLSQKEAHHLVVELNDRVMEYSNESCIHELFEQQAQQSPDNIAVVFEAEQLTYGELNARANQLAHYLVQQQDVKPDTLVGLCVERSVEMLIGILGILKAGGAYVPLDPKYPSDRLAYMIEDAKLDTIVSNELAQHALETYSGYLIDINDETIIKNYSTENLDKASLGLTSSHLAYVIYTSGSTGKPKGVMIERKSLLDYMMTNSDGYFSSSLTGSLVISSLSFDLTLPSIYLPLLHGKSVELINNEGVIGDCIEKLTANDKAKLIRLTPSHLKIIVEQLGVSKVQGAHTLVIGGEALDPSLVNDFYDLFPHSELINHYGPSESTIGCSFHKLNKKKYTTDESIPIGQSMMNTELYILNAHQGLAPKGGGGELYVGGNGLARGYLNRPELTKERFIDNPFYDECKPNSSKKLYRTGDLVRYFPDGSLEFIGRVDDQVKIRGFRIEIGEVEAQLLKLEGVESALLMAKELTGSQQLIGYVKSKVKLDDSAHASYVSELKSGLLNQLPEYMVPSILVVVNEWPLTPNGKVDRKALPEPDASVLQKEYVAPTTQTEKTLVEIWSELLNVNADKLSVTANFFELGGHSLLIMKLIGLATDQGLHIEAQDVFTAPNLQVLANLNDTHFAQRDAAAFVVPDNLIPEQCEQITPDMLPLVNLTDEEISHIAQQVPKGVKNIEDIYPLGPLQAGILYTHMISEGHDLYVTPLLFKVNNQTALDDFLEGMNFLIQRHDVLRTMVLHEGLSQPVQVVCKDVSLPVKWLDMPTGTDVRAAMFERSSPEQQWLDLSQAPLFQLQVAQQSEHEYYILLQMHHLITDHVSLEIIQREINAFHAGQSDMLEPVRPYRNFIAYTAEKSNKQEAESHFTATLGDVEEPTAPFDLMDIRNDGADIDELVEPVSDELAQTIRTLSRQLKLSPASIFHAAFSLVVAACSNKQDVVFGSVMSGRLQGLAGTESMIGIFMNTLPVRAQLASKTVLEFVCDIHDYLQTLLTYEQTPLTLAQNCSGVEHNSPLFSAMLNYRHSAMDESVEIPNEGEERDIELIFSQERSNYPFNLIVDDFGVGFALDFQVDPLVDVGRVMAYMQTALAGVTELLANAPDTSVDALNVLPTEELNYLTCTLNNTVVDNPKGRAVHELF